MSLISASTAPIFKIPGAVFTGLAAPSRGARENSVWRVTLEPGTPAHPHRLTREEIFVAVSGSAEAQIGDTRYTLTAGCALIVPRQTEFALSNPSDEPFEAVVVLPIGGEAIIGDEPPFIPPWAA